MLKNSVILTNLDMKCYMDNKPDRKTNLYTKSKTRSKRSFRKDTKPTSPLSSAVVDGFLSEGESPRSDTVAEVMEPSSYSDCESSDGSETVNDSSPSSKGNFIKEMVGKFDRGTCDLEQKKCSTKISPEVKGQCVVSDSLNSQLTAMLKKKSEESNSCRARNMSESAIADERSTQACSRTKPSLAPKPKFHSTSLSPKNSTADQIPNGEISCSRSPKGNKFCVVEAYTLPNPKTKPPKNNTAVRGSNLSVFTFDSLKLNQTVGVDGKRSDTEIDKRVETDVSPNCKKVGIATADHDVVSDDITQGSNEDCASVCPAEKVSTQSCISGRLPSSSASRSSGCPQDHPPLPKVNYVNEGESKKFKRLSVSHSDPSFSSVDSNAKGTENALESTKELQGENDACQDSSACISKPPRLTDVKHDEQMYRTNSNDDFDDDIQYEIPPLRRSSGNVMRQLTASTPNSAQSDIIDHLDFPIPPPRPSNVPSPGGSPLPAPRKLSKGHISDTQLSQVVLPSKPGGSKFSNVDTPPLPQMVPRLPPRTPSTSHSPCTPLPALPRRMSSGVQSQTLQYPKRRAIPPPSSITEEPQYSDESQREPPAIPQRYTNRQSSSAEQLASTKKTKKLSSGTAKGRSTGDLRKAGSNLSLAVSVPVGGSFADGQISPSRSEGYLRQVQEGYLPMGSQRSSTVSTFSRSDSLNELYMGHGSPLSEDDHPGVPPRQSIRSNLDRLVTRDNSYLDLCPDEEENYGNYSYLSLYNENEPLYQIYHQDAVVRHVLEQNIDTDEDCDSYYSPQEYVERAKLCVNGILKRDSGKENVDSEKVIKSLSTLENAARLGTGFRQLWCEMPKVKESGLLNHMGPEERKLQESAFEILSSEASYLKSMSLLVDHFMGKLKPSVNDKEKGVLSKRDFNWLFSNARAVRDVCIKMLEALEKIWQDGCVLKPLVLCSTITEVVQEHYGVYVTYCSNATYQERKFKELMEKSPEFRYAVGRLEDCIDCRSLPLSSFLALPMQRITRMPLLVSAMCRHLKQDDASSVEVTRCIHALQKMVQQCNEGARKMSNLEQISNIDKVLDFRSVKRIPLISQSRFLVKKGFVTHLNPQQSGMFKRSKQTLFFFLFNDLLVITKKKSDRQYVVLEHCPRSHIHAEALTDEDVFKCLPHGVPSSCKNLFCMALIEKRIEFILSCESQSEQMRWIQAVTPVERCSADEVVYVDWDCPQVQAVMRYASSEPDELALEESDIINVVRKANDGWYEGERIRDGERGWFPAHCTIEIQNAHVRARNLRQQYQLTKKMSSCRITEKS